MKRAENTTTPETNSPARDLIAANGWVRYYEAMWQQRLLEGGPSMAAWALSQLRIARKYADQARRRATMEHRRNPPPLYPSPCCKVESRLRGIFHGLVLMRCTSCQDYWERPLPPSPKLVYSAPQPLERRKRERPRLHLT